MSLRRGSLYISCFFALTVFGGILGPGKYNGVVVFDRWGGCHLYSGARAMEISESAKELLRRYADQPILVDAKEVHQPINPGDGLIRKLEVLGPSEEPNSSTFGKPPLLDGLGLKVLANFSAPGAPELIIELRNTGSVKRSVDTEAIGPTLLAKKQGLECFAPSDGPSYVAVTRTNINFMHQYPVGGSCTVDGKGRTVRMWLANGIVIPKTFDMEPGESFDIPLQFELSEGEYEFLAGYGGGVHEARTLVSNRIAFDVGNERKPRLVGASMSEVGVPRTRRIGSVCGRITSEGGGPMANAEVFLWPLPLPKQELRAANHAITGKEGEFRMENVTEGRYALSARRIDEQGAFAGASGGRHLADASSLEMPVDSETCPVRLTMKRVPTYAVRGKATPPPADQTFKARMILKRGDAYPFEMSVPIESDGHYEFKSIPAGRYQFFAGNMGSGFEVEKDIEDYDVILNWAAFSRGGHGTAMPIQFHEAMARSNLSGFFDHLQAYESQYHRGFPETLKVLGQPPSWARPNADHAGLVNDNFPGHEFADDGSYISEGSYRITYQPGPANRDGDIKSYLLFARPVEFGKTGKHSFVVDESGNIHATDENRSATLFDPIDVR